MEDWSISGDTSEEDSKKEIRYVGTLIFFTVLWSWSRFLGSLASIPYAISIWVAPTTMLQISVLFSFVFQRIFGVVSLGFVELMTTEIPISINWFFKAVGIIETILFSVSMATFSLAFAYISESKVVTGLLLSIMGVFRILPILFIVGKSVVAVFYLGRVFDKLKKLKDGQLEWTGIGERISAIVTYGIRSTYGFLILIYPILLIISASVPSVDFRPVLFSVGCFLLILVGKSLPSFWGLILLIFSTKYNITKFLDVGLFGLTIPPQICAAVLVGTKAAFEGEGIEDGMLISLYIFFGLMVGINVVFGCCVIVSVGADALGFKMGETNEHAVSHSI